MNNLTICILAYNAEDYINETLDSIEMQTGDFQYLIIIDGATDRTESLCNSFVLKSKHPVKMKVFKENQGTAFCRQWALDNIATEYIMFFDSDDVASPNLVQTLYSKIESNKNCIAVGCQAQYINVNGKKLPGGIFFKLSDSKMFMERAAEGKLMFMVPATMFRREYAIRAGGYRQNGFPEGEIRYQDLSEDLDIWSRMSDFYKENKYMIIVPKILYYYRKRSGSLSEAKDRQFAMSLKIKFIKYNLKNRRAGKKEITFIDFLSSRTVWDKIQDKRCFYSEYYYRKAAFAFAEQHFSKIVLNLPISIILNPKYFVQKIVANILS